MKSLRRLAKRILGRDTEFKPDWKATVESGSYLDRAKVVSRKGCRLAVGTQSHVSAMIHFDKDSASLNVGSRTFVATSIFCAREIFIGDDVMIALGGAIFDHDSHSLHYAERANDVTDWIADRKDWSNVTIKPVHIASRAWLGYGVIVTKGVTIGEGAVIGAGSVVTKSVPAWTLWAGNPAKYIRDLPAPAVLT